MAKLPAAKRWGQNWADIRLRIVNCIRGHENFGEDSEFYRFLGFKTKAERKTGLTRKKQDGTDAGASTGDSADYDEAA